MADIKNNTEIAEDPSITFFKESLKDDTDCFPCRLISSTGLLFGGTFILMNRNNFGKVNGIFQTVIGVGFVFTSFLRVFGFPPFQVKSEDGLLFKL